MARRVKEITWAYGVTTVPSRRKALLPQTLLSLKAAGFPSPRLFVDGDVDGLSWEKEFNLEVTCHGRAPVRAYGNWFMALAELYLRDPRATFYAIFQDDLITYKNLRQFIEKSCPPGGYLNLFTFPLNASEELRRYKHAAPADDYIGWYPSNQLGLGAVGIVLPAALAMILLCHPHMINRVQDVNRGHKSIDGAVVSAMKKAGYTEFVHFPTLVQHTGTVSSLDNQPHPAGIGFMGEAFDALNLLPEQSDGTR